MSTFHFQRLRIGWTGLVTVAELLHLAWEFTHGGVQSHHLLARPDLPAISNWWGLLLLPVLAWLLIGSLRNRVLAPVDGADKALRIPGRIVAGFVGALGYALLLALAFTQGNEDLAGYLFLGLLLMAAVLPVYRAEYVLGLILGLTFTFGAILPSIIALIVAMLSTALQWLIRQLIRFVRGVSIRLGLRTAQPKETL
jgi:hypothetical protein